MAIYAFKYINMQIKSKVNVIYFQSIIIESKNHF